METVADTKEGVTELTGLMTEMMEALTATHEDVRSIRSTVTTLVPQHDVFGHGRRFCL
jgi:hypothetical protein